MAGSPLITLFCGGNGSGSICSELVRTPGVDLTTIVNAYDDGKSTGAIRRLLGILGPSDIRKNHWHFMSLGDQRSELLRRLWHLRLPVRISEGDARRALSSVCQGIPDEHGIYCLIAALDQITSDAIRTYLSRFLRALDEKEALRRTGFTFRDCCVGNMVYAGAFAKAGWDVYSGIASIESLLGIRARVRPVSPDSRWIAALTVSGDVIGSEVEADAYSMDELLDIYLLEEALSIDQLRSLAAVPPEVRRSHLQQLSKPPVASPQILSSLRSASIIVYGPGTLSTSLLPTYLASGIGAAIRSNRSAKKVLVTNICGEESCDASKTLRYTAHFLARSDHDPGPPHCYVNVILAPRQEPWTEAVEDKIGVITREFADPYRPRQHCGAAVMAALLDSP